jgi:hypothetical protein
MCVARVEKIGGFSWKCRSLVLTVTMAKGKKEIGVGEGGTIGVNREG